MCVIFIQLAKLWVRSSKRTEWSQSRIWAWTFVEVGKLLQRFFAGAAVSKAQQYFLKKSLYLLMTVSFRSGILIRGKEEREETSKKLKCLSTNLPIFSLIPFLSFALLSVRCEKWVGLESVKCIYLFGSKARTHTQPDDQTSQFFHFLKYHQGTKGKWKIIGIFFAYRNIVFYM